MNLHTKWCPFCLVWSNISCFKPQNISYKWRAQNHSELTHQTLHGFVAWHLRPLNMFATCNIYRSKGHLCYSSHSYLLQVMYTTFQYLAVLCIPAVDHVCMMFQYLTISCIPTISNISKNSSCHFVVGKIPERYFVHLATCIK